MPSAASTFDVCSKPRRFDAFAVLGLMGVVALVYSVGLLRPSVVGEETRWGSGAREMLTTGDWIVPHQQGIVFPERPPMTMWAMAAIGWLRGDVDALAIRLPSVIAVVLTTILIYAYVRSFAAPVAALISAIVYATMGQVLQIGRLGESEALFALFVSASLLLWHIGYMSNWRPLATWAIGFAFAGLAALVKGPQAPIYFVAITATYLLVLRDWRYLVCWQYTAGAAVFVAIVGTWQVPFYLATDWETVVATWSGLASDRLMLSGLAKHFVSYPVETFACLLPWAPLLVALAKRETRELLRLPLPPGEGRGEGALAPPSEPSPCPLPKGEGSTLITTFLFTALLVAYPTVWIAAGARGRYFMPLYPISAVLIGLIIDRCSTACRGTYPRRAWRQFLLLAGSLIAAGGVFLGVCSLLPAGWIHWLHQPRIVCLAFTIVAFGAAFMIWKCYAASHRFAPLAAVATIAAFVGAAHASLMTNVNASRWYDPAEAVAIFAEYVPEGAPLVSLTPIDHRFAYYYREPIGEIGWPQAVSDLPPDVEYFCFMRKPTDTAKRRDAGRGRTWTTTPGTLPFAWVEVTSMKIDRRANDGPQQSVVLGRVVRPLTAMVNDATKPQPSVAAIPSTQRRR